MTDLLAEHIQWAASHAPLWGFVFVFVFMTIESSFIPFPSEVVMIPAGFMACRGELTFANPIVDLLAVIAFGVLGSMAGAYANYYLSLKLGRPVLHKYGKYVFLSPSTLDRAEEIFREYGDITTFACRLLPGIRQLISIPAGVSKMSIVKFSVFTALGAGIWTIILALIGYYFGSLSGDMTYIQLVHKGKDALHQHFVWILLGLAVIVGVYAFVHHAVMKSRKAAPEQE